MTGTDGVHGSGSGTVCVLGWQAVITSAVGFGGTVYLALS